MPEGSFRLGKWGWTVCIVAALYLGLMLLNVVVPTGLSSGRALFNLDWITLLVMTIIALIGALYFFIARPDRKVASHLHDELERPAPSGTAEPPKCPHPAGPTLRPGVRGSPEVRAR